MINGYESAGLLTNPFAGWLENHHTLVCFWKHRNSAGTEADFHRNFHSSRRRADRVDVDNDKRDPTNVLDA